ncbi:hypothetical protein AM10699_24830 [Acaryochloris marina MBIC10699]|nr:hypothetical protein AM10699_24830 [Acaryochloris marina MBIC10699]
MRLVVLTAQLLQLLQVMLPLLALAIQRRLPQQPQQKKLPHNLSVDCGNSHLLSWI